MNRGLTITELVVVMAIASVVSLGIVELYERMQSASKSIESHSVISDISHRISEYIQNDSQWLLAVQDSENTMFDCVRNSTLCETTSLSMKLTGLYGSKSYDPRIGTSGFSTDGAICNSFSDPAVSNACPFRYEVNVRPICSVPCESPSIFEIVGVFKVSSKDMKIQGINPSRYNFRQIKLQNLNIPTSMELNEVFTDENSSDQATQDMQAELLLSDVVYESNGSYTVTYHSVERDELFSLGLFDATVKTKISSGGVTKLVVTYEATSKRYLFQLYPAYLKQAIVASSKTFQLPEFNAGVIDIDN